MILSSMDNFGVHIFLSNLRFSGFNDGFGIDSCQSVKWVSKKLLQGWHEISKKIHHWIWNNTSSKQVCPPNYPFKPKSQKACFHPVPNRTRPTPYNNCGLVIHRIQKFLCWLPKFSRSLRIHVWVWPNVVTRWNFKPGLRIYHRRQNR